MKKKRLQNMKNMLELFVFLEREGLISHTSAEPLVGLLQKIKRADLVDHVNEMFGKLQWLSQNAEKMTHIKGKALDLA